LEYVFFVGSNVISGGFLSHHLAVGQTVRW